MTNTKPKTDDEYMMSELCKTYERMGEQLIQVQQQKAAIEISARNIRSLLVGMSDDIAELGKKGVKKPDLEETKKAVEKEAQSRVGGIQSG